jgi:CelD/BcsL family acetyltransferase involved in cellulose biosynthesis
LGVALDERRGAGSSQGVMKLRIHTIEKAQDFMALAPIWAQLAKTSGQLSPFLSYDWFWCCWHGVWPQRRPEILVIEEPAGPVAIVALMHWRGWMYGLPVRYVGFLECPITPWVDVLTTGAHDNVVATFLDHLSSRSDWDIAWLQKLPAASPTLKALEGTLPGRLSWRRASHLAYPYVAIDGDWDRFSRTLDEAGMKSHRHEHAQLQRAGNLRLKEHRMVDFQSPLLQETLAVMNSHNHPGHAITTMPRQREFFRTLTQRAAKNGWLSLWTLKLDDHIMAMEYQLHSDGRVQVLAVGEDSSYHALRPWPELNLAILQALFRSGCTYEYSLGPAAQHDRLWWVNGHHQTVQLKLYRPSLYTRILAQLDAATVSGAG